jgi:hypothetical protein
MDRLRNFLSFQVSVGSPRICGTLNLENRMNNRYTGFKILVHGTGIGSYVAVPRHQVDEISQLFVKMGIGHSLSATSSEYRGTDDEQTINIGRLWDIRDVQNVLDSVQ